MTGTSVPGATVLSAIQADSIWAVRRCGQKVDTHVDGFELGKFCGIYEEAVEFVAPPTGEQHGRGHGSFGGRLHGAEFDFLLTFDMEFAAETVGGLFGEIVEVRDGVEVRGHHQIGRPLMIDENAEMEIAFGMNAVICVEGGDVHGDGNHLRGFAEFTFDGAMPILLKGTDHFGSVAHFRRLIGRSEGSDNFVFGERHLDGPRLNMGWPKARMRLPSL